MSKYIIFKAENASTEQWKKMILAHTGACTDILAEHYDSSKRPLPQPGYRLKEYHRIEQFVDPKFPGASTHSRVGDWEVSRVEEYVPDLPVAEFETIVICYCRYAPITSPLEPLPEIQVSQQLQEA
ncbi:hypothetical protein DSM106972_047340 [Dulcicalothrix desertica PCC 7102]|uniref:Uncharacterized protein n=1 Tax=Dulcicalothrix desertica PCC 7102 TaxID=232991 RepID=A0A433VCI0_9CYAN|nr:hypothetical protein [Dulcicalothrix desertica]RUT03820.1 hypothetical protein DSM106972_047340 [Dulcicalothrix desertica PCC 7102]TWH43771.1 hypothetical protein CAL7102_07515 [Dulcicalothrix desertica PCC 7102]